jgi:hypothetical protein
MALIASDLHEQSFPVFGIAFGSAGRWALRQKEKAENERENVHVHLG